MGDHPTNHDKAVREALADVERRHPGWHCWPGVIPPLLYARRPRSSPPIVVRSTTLDGLRAEIERVEAERRIR